MLSPGRRHERTTPPLTARRLVLRVLPIVAAAAVVLCLRETGVSLSTLVDGGDAMRRLLARMWPPDFERLWQLVVLVWETLLIAVAGTTAALLVSLPLSVLAASNTTPGPWVRAVARAVIAVTRAIPSLVFAIVFVRALGLGAFPGALAIGIHSVGMLGKLFADAIEQAQGSPDEAVMATGARRMQAVVATRLPQAAPAIIGLALYRLDINVRASSVLGLVGAGGIGVALNTALGTLNYPRALAIVAVIFVLIMIIERVSVWMRQAMLGSGAADVSSDGEAGGRLDQWLTERQLPPLNPAARSKYLGATLGVVLFCWSIAGLGITLERVVQSVPRLADMVSRMWPLPVAETGAAVASAVGESIAMGIAATGVGVAAALPVAFLGAHDTIANRGVAAAVRYLVVAMRGIPELIIALLFVAAVGLGPFAGVMALSIGMFAFSAKLFMDALEEIPRAPVEGLEAVGASTPKRTLAAIWPQFVPGLVGGALFVVDLAMRQSVILGLVGAGGVGFLLQQSVATLQYDVTALIMVAVFVAVQVIETISGRVRRLLL